MAPGASIEQAIELSERGYRLIRWLGDAVGRGFISADSAHGHASFPDAARAWIIEHYENLPLDARPPRGDMQAFANLFVTYLEGSFDLHAAPGQRLHSPGAHCFCPWCSWLVSAPHLQPKKPSARDRTRARKMPCEAVRSAAREQGVRLADAAVDAIVDDPSMREPVALCAYADDLLRRLDGISAGPAQLVLWRRFAWEPTGSPKKRFRLTAAQIADARTSVHERVGAMPKR